MSSHPATSSNASPPKREVDILNEVVVKAAGKSFTVGETEPVSGMANTMYRTLIEEVRAAPCIMTGGSVTARIGVLSLWVCA